MTIVSVGALLHGMCDAEAVGGSQWTTADGLVTAPDYEYECHMDDGALFYLCLHCLYAWERVIRESDRLQEST